MVDYKLIRSERKTIQIQVLPDKTIEVRAPKNVSKKRINDFVVAKEKWIIAKIDEKREIAQIPVNHFYVPGETFYFRGRQYTLKSFDDSVKKNTVCLIGNNLIIQTKIKTPESFQKTFVCWQKKRAKDIFIELFEECWNYFENYYSKYEKPILTVRTMKTRWGSLSQNGKTKTARMTLNTLLVCSNNNCIKQVIYHELCHLVHPNHGKDFYDTFEFFVPDWKELKKDLESLFLVKN